MSIALEQLKMLTDFPAWKEVNGYYWATLPVSGKLSRAMLDTINSVLQRGQSGRVSKEYHLSASRVGMDGDGLYDRFAIPVEIIDAKKLEDRCARKNDPFLPGL